MRCGGNGTNSKVVEQRVADNNLVLDERYDLGLDLLICRL